MYKRCCLNVTSAQRHSHYPQLFASSIVMYRMLYFYLSRLSLDVFSCQPTTPPDGFTYMAGLLQYPCGGAVQNMLLFPAIVTFSLYSVGLPAAALLFLRAKKNIVKYE